MKQEVTPELMASLAPGDTVFPRIGGSLVLTEKNFKFDKDCHYKWIVRIFDLWSSYDDNGFVIQHPLDVVAIEKAATIPPGFTKCEGSFPGNIGTVELLTADGKIHGPYYFDNPTSYCINIIDSSKVIGYRTIPPKTSGEIWAVVHQVRTLPLELHHWPTKEQAIRYAKSVPSDYKILAVFQPFATGGKWVEGQGLELLEEEKT